MSVSVGDRFGEGRHVLVLVENLSVPFDRRVWQECRTLVEAGFHVSVVCPKGSKRDTEERVTLEGVEIWRFDLAAATGGPLGYVREYGTAFWRMSRLVRRLHAERSVDIVHACNPPDLLFLAAGVVRRSGARMMFDHHDLVPELLQSRFGRGGLLYRATVLAERLNFRIAHSSIATNESYRAAAIERGRMDPERVHVVRSAPDLSRFGGASPDPSIRGSKRYVLGYVGVMGPQDGVDYALRAIAELSEARDDFCAVFVGGGDVLDEMRALSEQLGIADIVTFTGRVSDEELATALASSDVCLAPDPLNPLNDVSTMNKIVEYMALGKPLVSFDLREARVSAGDAAVYVTPNDTALYAKAIGDLLDDEAERTRRGEIGRQRVADELSWERSAQNLRAAYRQILELH